MCRVNWLSWILFESLAALGAVLGVVLFALLVHWRRSGRPRALLIGLAVAVVLFIVQALVVTQREHAARILTAIENDLVASRSDALAAALSPDFAWDHPRGDFISYVERQLTRVDIRWVERFRLRVSESQPDRFTVLASYRADIATPGYAGSLPSTWSLTFVRTPDGWKIIQIKPVRILGYDNPTWLGLERR